MNYFPVFFDLTGQKVLVVGGGDVALRKISLLERTSALITVVAPDVAPELLARAASGKLKLANHQLQSNWPGSRTFAGGQHQGSYADGHVGQQWLSVLVRLDERYP